MILPLLRKDLELHRLGAVAVPLLYIAVTVTAVLSSNNQAAEVVSIPLYTAGFFLLTALVQGDPIPSDRADWLIRPIRRRDLLLAKLAFVALVFLLPMITVDLLVPFGLGFDAQRVVGAAFGHALSIFFGLILPTMALAAATSNMAQCAIGATLAGFAYSMMMPFLPWSVERDVAVLQWMEDLAVLAIAGCTSIVILLLQYFGRRTRWSYAVALTGLAAIGALSRVPFHEAWDLQANLRPVTGFEDGFTAKPVESDFCLRSGSPLHVRVPIQVSGRNSEFILIPQRADMRIRFSNGEVRQAVTQDLREVNLVNGTHPLEFDFGVDAELYDLRDKLAEPEITIRLLAFKPLVQHEFASENKPQVFPETGRCHIVREKEAVIGECLQVGDDSPSTNISFRDGLDNWAELPLDRISSVFLRFGATVFRWKSKMMRETEVKIDLRDPVQQDPKDPKFFKQTETVQIKSGRFAGIVVKRIPVPSGRFSSWRVWRK
jgi:hypothetical protein